MTTGGTGLTPRDVTPQATLAVIDYEVPGLAEAMRAEGRRFTPMAALSRGVVGVAGRALVVNLPGSPRGAIESLEAIADVLDHALDTLAGPYDHGTRSTGARPGSSTRSRRGLMFPTFAHVTAYPLVFPLFYGAAVIFGVVMARHLRIFAVARRLPAVRRTCRDASWASWSTRSPSARCSATCGPALLHAGIFWGFVLLTIGTANIVTGGLVQAVISWPLDGALWVAVSAMQNIVAVIVLASIVWAFERRLVSRPRRLTYTRDALIILAHDRRGRGDRAAGPGRRGGPLRRRAGRLRGEPAGDPAPVARPEPRGGRCSSSCGGATSRSSPRSCVYLPFSKHLHIVTSFPNIYLRKLAPRGELPAMDLEAEDATFGLRTLQDLGWKDLLDGFTCTECGRCSEACPA